MKNYQALYVFYEKNGEITDDVAYYLSELKKVVPEILVIVNGKITPSGREMLEKMGLEILVRENKGLDFAAWKAGIEEIGWDKLYETDGLLLCNCSCFGPVYPFEEMFQAMEGKRCDFWGINRHPEMEVCLVPDNPASKVLEHIQSYFLFFRPRLVRSKHFKKWWDNLTEYSDYCMEVGLHETKFTAYLEDAGFRSATYMDFDKYKKLMADNASIQCCEIQLIQDRNPLIKKKIFSADYRCYLSLTSGSQVADLMEFIKNKTTYITDYIYDYIIKHNKLSASKNSLHLNYILPTDISKTGEIETKTALLLYIYYEDCIEYCRDYAQAMPENSDIYVIISKPELKKKCLEKFGALKCNHLECRMMENRGRDVAAYLIAGRDVFEKYDYVCCVHDKKSPAAGELITGYHYAQHCFKSLLYNSDYVRNVLKIFADNPKLGMLVPPVLNFSVFYHLLGKEMWQETGNIKAVMKMLKFNVPCDEQSVIPFGTMFWVRGKAFLPMFNHDWKYEDFPEEPCRPACTILHALERVYPFAPQMAGYLAGMVLPDKYAAVMLDNQYFMLRELNVRLFNKLGVSDFATLENRIGMSGDTFNFSSKFRKALRQYSMVEYYFYKVLSKITMGRLRKRCKQKKVFWKQTKEQFRRK